MTSNSDIAVNLLVVAIQVFLLTFGLRYVGFNGEQTLILTMSIVGAIHIK